MSEHLDQVVKAVTIVLGTFVLVVVASVIYAAAVIVRLQREMHRLRRPEVARDSQGRPLKERV
jgi:cell division protein FtsL